MAVKPTTGFWGAPRFKPQDKDVANYLESIRKVTEKLTKERRLEIATAAMKAIIAFIAEEYGPKECLAVTEAMLSEVKGCQ